MEGLIWPKVKGFVLIRDRDTGEVLVDKMNKIHPESLSEAIANSLANRAKGHVHEMVFGNGASTVSGTGAITYFPPNVTAQDAHLYNQTYRKVVDDLSPLNSDAANNKIRVSHTAGQTYSDLTVTCTLDFNEPSGQQGSDDAADAEGNFVFDEIGLKAYDIEAGAGKLLTHVVFHPVLKSLNRSIEIIYTLRIFLS